MKKIAKETCGPLRMSVNNTTLEIHRNFLRFSEKLSLQNRQTLMSVVDVEEDETGPVYVSELPDMVLPAKQRDDILLIAGESDDEIGTEFSGDVSEESSDDESE